MPHSNNTPKFAPTPEQEQARRLFATGQSLAIEAGAGTGKTSTLQLLAADAEKAGRRGQYLAFNRAIVHEAKSKFPKNVNVSTAHALAWHAVAEPFLPRAKSGARMRTIDIANRLKIDGLNVKDSEGNHKHLSRSFLASLAMRAVERFCQSADAEPTLWHVPYVEGLDAPNLDGTGHRRGVNNKFVAKHIEPAVKRAWDDLSSPEGSLPFTTSRAMSVYLKLWQLSKPHIDVDFILFDEAQDANPVMLDVVNGQTHAQLVFVGDSQQQIYEFTGAVNALGQVNAENTAYLTQSFRFGPAVAAQANHILGQIDGAKLRLSGFEKIDSKVEPTNDPNAVLCRSNACAVETVLNAQNDGTKVHLVGGGNEIVNFTIAARKLQNGERTDHPELACFESWAEVVDYVDQDEQGGDLKLLVSLIERFGVETILAALDGQVKEHEAELIVSTAHKAKGREWDKVQLAGDFKAERLVGNPSELRLLYVAVTRARLVLDITQVEFLTGSYVLPTPVSPEGATTPSPEEPEVSEAQVEVVPTKPSEWYGAVGDRLDLALRCDAAIPVTTPYGDTFIHSLVDDETGNVFKAFIDDPLTEGKLYDVTGKVKSHETFRDVKETRLNYVKTYEKVTA
jgi:hypothetical protein